MGTVTIGTRTYDVYGDADGLEEYGQADLALAPTLAAAGATTRAQALVSASRLLDRQAWAGAKTSSSQAQAWPRVGATDREGAAIDSSSIPQDVIEACYELAIAAIADPGALAKTSTENLTKRVDAKGVSVEFFGPQAGERFSPRVMELVGYLLAGSGAVASLGIGASYSAGTDGESAFDRCDEYGLTSG